VISFPPERIEEAPTISGDLFEGYSRAQKLNALTAILNAVSIMREHYPDQWLRLEQKLDFLNERLAQSEV